MLVVDDEKNARQGLKHFLSELNYDVLEAGSGEEALLIVKKHRPEIVLADLRMPGMEQVAVPDSPSRRTLDTLAATAGRAGARA